MSWPADGKPRYVVAQIEGAAIVEDSGAFFHGGYTGPEAYVYDRADCHRIVRAFKRHKNGRRSALVRATKLCEALNMVEAGAKVPLSHRGALVGL